MTTRANFAYNMDEQMGIHESVVSTMFKIIAKNDEGVVLAWSNVTGAAECSAARVAAGSPQIAPGAWVMCVHSVAAGVTTPWMLVNIAATGSVTWQTNVCSS